jgi:hypothetical protein
LQKAPNKASFEVKPTVSEGTKILSDFKSTIFFLPAGVNPLVELKPTIAEGTTILSDFKSTTLLFQVGVNPLVELKQQLQKAPKHYLKSNQ